MFHELTDVLAQLSKDESCRVVLITSTDSSFCHGVDFSSLVQPSAEKRLAAAQDMAKALKYECIMLFLFTHLSNNNLHDTCQQEEESTHI